MTSLDTTHAPNVQNILREATRSRHSAMDHIPQMERLFAVDYTLAEYRAHLQRLLGLFEPLEASAAQTMPADVASYFHPRADAIRDDLLALGCDAHAIDALERCDHLPSLPARGSRGFVYVMLGSMLGGRVIARRLRTVLGAHAPLGFYGDGSGRNDGRWTAFCADLERHGRADVEALCTTANATFDAYAAWMQPLPGTSTP